MKTADVTNTEGPMGTTSAPMHTREAVALEGCSGAKYILDGEAGAVYSSRIVVSPIKPQKLAAHLDEKITFWRGRRACYKTGDERRQEAQHYIDAYQGVRVAMLGESLPWNS